MTKFYTHFSKLGNRLFVKEVDGKIRKQHKIPINPSLFVKAETDDVSDFTTLYGDKLTQFDFDTCTAAREFVDSIGNTPVFGYNRFEYVAAHERYPGKSVEFDPSMINVGIFDIETECEGRSEKYGPEHKIKVRKKKR